MQVELAFTSGDDGISIQLIGIFQTLERATAFLLHCTYLPMGWQCFLITCGTT